MGIRKLLGKKITNLAVGSDNTKMSVGGRFFANMIKTDANGLPSSLSLRGKAIFGSAAAMNVIVNNYEAAQRDNLGSVDGKIYTNTPDYNVYNQRRSSPLSAPGGADGSLVFALDKTKNGGYL